MIFFTNPNLKKYCKETILDIFSYIIIPCCSRSTMKMNFCKTCQVDQTLKYKDIAMKFLRNYIKKVTLNFSFEPVMYMIVVLYEAFWRKWGRAFPNFEPLKNS